MASRTGRNGSSCYSRCPMTRTGTDRRPGDAPRRFVMNYIDPHIHMVSRVTDDYQRMARCGCAAVSEPAFWAGFGRGSAAAFHDYFRQLTEYEPKRAAEFLI